MIAMMHLGGQGSRSLLGTLLIFGIKVAIAQGQSGDNSNDMPNSVIIEHPSLTITNDKLKVTLPATQEDRCANVVDGKTEEDGNCYMQELYEIETSGSEADCNDDYFVCEDYYARCDQWARKGWCQSASKVLAFVREDCQQSCNVCYREDSKGPLPAWHYGLGEDLGVPQQMVFDDVELSKEQILWALEEARVYLKGHGKQLYGKDFCSNHDPMCTFWALTGECVDNAEFMAHFCAPMCRRCDDIEEDRHDNTEDDEEIEVQNDREYEDAREEEDMYNYGDENDGEDYDCFEGLVDAWQPGDIEKTFRRLSSEPFTSNYAVEILSSPDTTGGPWIVTIDGVVTDEEARTFIELGNDDGFERSITSDGEVNDEGSLDESISTKRTSSTAWCSDECMQLPLISNVMERLSDFVQIPSANSEFLQILKYTRGQKYDVHHDMIPAHVMNPQGPRILTAYMYLNDEVEGGGTRFDKLNVTVMPKRGRVLLWPSVLDSDMREADDRTTHQALPVISGTKYGTNAWFHLNNFKNALDHSCLEETLEEYEEDEYYEYY